MVHALVNTQGVRWVTKNISPYSFRGSVTQKVTATSFFSRSGYAAEASTTDGLVPDGDGRLPAVPKV